MKIKNRQDFLVIMTVVVVALAVLVNFIFPPIVGWWKDRQQQIAQLRDQVHQGVILIRGDADTRKKWKNMEDNALPANPSDAEQQFLRALDGWAHDSGVEISGISPQPWKSDSTNYMTFNCRVETSGDMGALTKFIYDIEKGPMAVRVGASELSTHDNAGEVLTLGLDLSGLALVNTDQK